MTEWMAYERVTGPLGPERGDLLHGILAAVIANSGAGRRRRLRRPQDFIPKWDTVRRRMNPMDMLAAVRSINAALGGSDGDQGTEADDGGTGRAARRDRTGRGRPHARRRGTDR
ncbi:phage tail assembly protein T [Streptomyces sp. URMC 129]|uniref:phage tail assembly protein T n=1 Tax=Streptomyces sp. URMC 129 TaxID=3423407 RepID=UPI003F1C26B0